MSTDLTFSKKTFGDDSHAWLGSAHAFETAESITLDGSTFTTLWTDGQVPSGVALGKINDGGADHGKYGLYDPGSNEVQSIVATGGSSGDFMITFLGETTAAIAFDATAAAVQAALELLTNVEPGDIVVTLGPLPTTAIQLTFQNQYGATNVAQVTITDNITGGSATASTVTQGAAGAATNGTQDFAGFLANKARVIPAGGTSAHDVIASMIWHGQIIVANLPTNHQLDSAAQTSVGAKLLHFV